jgi:hypothetical protein
LKWDLRN